MEYIKEGKKCNRITEDGTSKEENVNQIGHTAKVMYIMYVCVDDVERNRGREREREREVERERLKGGMRKTLSDDGSIRKIRSKL